MAVYTTVSLTDGQRLATAHALGRCLELDAVAAGSVNTNYILRTDVRSVFLRVYEEQDAAGVAYEWELLAHLAAHGIPVPRLVSGSIPGQHRVGGKPTALFELLGGTETCQRGVTISRAEAVGAMLAKCHQAGADFGQRQASRFNLGWLEQQLDEIRRQRRPELAETVVLLRDALGQAKGAQSVQSGVIHGDLFRDNVRWEGDIIVGLLDWESASDGALAYDIMVTLLAWCYGDEFEWELAGALMRGYQKHRALDRAELLSLHGWGIAAATRFSITRILSFHLREDAIGDRVIRDYRRFVQRLQVLRSLSPQQFADRLTS